MCAGIGTLLAVVALALFIIQQNIHASPQNQNQNDGENVELAGMG